MYQNAAPNNFGFYQNNNLYGQGVVPNQQTMPKTGNWLSPDKIAGLQKSAAQFNLSVSDEDIARGQCNHYNINGTSALIPDADGSGGCRCAICGTHFTSREFTQDEVVEDTQKILDILNTIKIMYLSLDPSAACDYFQIIPFIEKIPELYNIACNDFKKYEGIDSFISPQGQNPFNVFNMMTNPAMGMYQQAAMNQAPMGYGQPMGYGMGMQPQPQPMNMGFAQPNPGFNPLYGQPMAPQGYQPQMQGYAMNPMGAAAPQGFVNTNMPQGNMPQQAAPQATAAPDASGKDVTVNAEFKK